MDTVYETIHAHVIDTLTHQLPDYLTYHSVLHTQYVLDKAIYIGRKEKVLKSQMRLLMIAALYHDIGFIKSNDEHEVTSCKIARKDLELFGIDKTDVDVICDMIMSTKIPQQPKTYLEAILADADLEYLGTKHFAHVSELLYEELRYFDKNLTKLEWKNFQIDFLTQHQYHTKFCKQYKSHRKDKNLESIKNY